MIVQRETRHKVNDPKRKLCRMTRAARKRLLNLVPRVLAPDVVVVVVAVPARGALSELLYDSNHQFSRISNSTFANHLQAETIHVESGAHVRVEPH